MNYIRKTNAGGGQALRTLREMYHKTQFGVELDASLGTGYLQRLELGKVQQPERETLDRVVRAIGANFAECRRVFESYGYTVPISIPSEAETQWAIDVFHTEVVQNTLPVYLLDFSHRLLTWNSLMPGLFAELANDTSFQLMPELIFDTAHEFRTSIINADEFFSAQIRTLHYENLRCGDEAWFKDFIEHMQQYASFNEHWEKYKKKASMTILTRPLAHLELNSTVGLLQFRLMSQTYAQDPRFRLIYYIPDDARTIKQCQGWSRCTDK